MIILTHVRLWRNVQRKRIISIHICFSLCQIFHFWMETRKLNAMSWQTWKTRIAREWLWFIFTVAGSSLLWYLVSCFFTEFWESLKIILLRLLSPEGGCVIKGRYEVIACLDVLSLMFVYILRFTAWSKRQGPMTGKGNQML